MPVTKYIISILFVILLPISVLAHTSMYEGKGLLANLIALGIVVISIVFILILSNWIDKKRNN
jgi:predicted short-subunit dehydrogenase-like oxidoreductase (DUF2520 family)|tara:strand:- start:7817 stop:8005 length:189 start_codon:yes stop_codon:yes gene_type:complete